jgi:ATP-binding cassette subfamily B protein
VVRVNLLAFEDADFQELARQGARYGVRSIETSLRWLADPVASVIALLASMLTAGLLNPWLAPVLLLAAVGHGWASARVAKLNYQHFLDTGAWWDGRPHARRACCWPGRRGPVRPTSTSWCGPSG